MIPTSRYLAGPFVAKRRNRRWIVATYWGFMVPVAVFLVWHTFSRPEVEFYRYPFTVLMVMNLWTYSRYGVKPVGLIPLKPNAAMFWFWPGPGETKEIQADWQFDEREARQRDRVYFRAYRWVAGISFVLFAGLTACLVVWPGGARWLGPVFLCLLIGVVAGVPQTLVLWNEPDVEEAG